MLDEYRFRLGLIAVFLMAQLSICYAQDEAVIDLDSTYQVIRGFGASNIMPWRPDMTEAEIEKAFGTGDGQLGFSILRLRLPSDENQFSLNLPTAKAAYNMGVTLIASPWSPPASMKTNNNTTGGELRETFYDDYAEYLNSFSDYMDDNGAPVYAVSVQNEPDIEVSYESCNYSPDQMLKFVKEHGAAVKTKLIAPESYQLKRDMSDPLLNDATALENFDIVGGHIYGGGLAPYPLAEEKGKEVWMTEHLILETSWSDNLSTGIDINDCLNNGMSAYIWWYIVRFYGPIYDDGSDTRTPDGAVKGEISKRGYVMSQFARFIRPGYLRVESPYIPQRGVYTSAYRDSATSKIVIIAINTSSLDKEQVFTLKNGTAETFIPYVTSESKDCVEENAIAVADAGFTVTLDASSITTFVSTGSATSVSENPSQPKAFGLNQNYPNPFNPSTIIEYSISERNAVTLKVFDSLGRDVATLFEGIRQSGDYSAHFDGRNLASGIYFYQLKSGNNIETKKLTLLK